MAWKFSLCTQYLLGGKWRARLCTAAAAPEQTISGAEATRLGWIVAGKSVWQRVPAAAGAGACPELPGALETAGILQLPAPRAGAVFTETAVQITISTVIYTADYFRARLGAEIYFRLKRCTNQDLHGTNYRWEMWIVGGLVLVPATIQISSYHRRSQTWTSPIHTGFFFSHLYRLRHYEKWLTGPIFI